MSFLSIAVAKVNARHCEVVDASEHMDLLWRTTSSPLREVLLKVYVILKKRSTDTTRRRILLQF